MARLPAPGGDDGTWGNILNDYLSQSLDAAGLINSNAVSTNQILDTSVTKAKLASTVQTSLNKADTAASQAVPVAVTTAATTVAKVGTTTGGSYSPTLGDVINVSFSLGCNVASPTLNIDGSGAKNIRIGNANVSTTIVSTATALILRMWYDGTYWQIYGSLKNDNTTYAEITSAEITAGTATTLGSITGRRAQEIVVKAQSGMSSSAALTAHTTNTSNPHAVTKTQVGLGNVDNTSDDNKPISTATQAALDLKAAITHSHSTFTPVMTSAIAPTPLTISQPNATTASNAELLQIYSEGTKTTWMNEWGAIRTRIPATKNADSVYKGLYSSSYTGVPFQMIREGAAAIYAFGIHADGSISMAETSSPSAPSTGLQRVYPKNDGKLYVKNSSGTESTVAYITDVTKTQVGLSNVDNTSDMNKPVSSAQSTAITAAAPPLLSTLIVETATGVWSGDATARTGGVRPIIFTGISDPADPTDGIDTPANIAPTDVWVKTMNTTGGGSGVGDMLKSTYDPTNIAASAFARANHTGTQIASTISDFDTSVAANSAVTANTAKVSNATHTGDVTGATALTIASSAVTNAKLANMATKTYKGRTSGTTGAPEDVTVATLKADLGLGKSDVGLGNVDNTSDANKPISTATQTALDAKALAKVTSSVTSSATLTPTGDAQQNELYVTALAVAATIAAPSGTIANGNSLLIRVKDDGTARALTWNAIYRAIGVTLPATTTAGKVLYIGAKYNSTDSKVDVIALGQE